MPRCIIDVASLAILSVDQNWMTLTQKWSHTALQRRLASRWRRLGVELDFSNNEVARETAKDSPILASR